MDMVVLAYGSPVFDEVHAKEPIEIHQTNDLITSVYAIRNGDMTDASQENSPLRMRVALFGFLCM